MGNSCFQRGRRCGLVTKASSIRSMVCACGDSARPRLRRSAAAWEHGAPAGTPAMNRRRPPKGRPDSSDAIFARRRRIFASWPISPFPALSIPAVLGSRSHFSADCTVGVRNGSFDLVQTAGIQRGHFHCRRPNGGPAKGELDREVTRVEAGSSEPVYLVPVCLRKHWRRKQDRAIRRSG